ncbi:hypothetical protein NVP1111B_40 [Vibrio phage 1.111.B._10N.286.45.E6]|nr:hypothetical protein NVP1111A_40 [Vibrio phage 1.111.A._10N.286.45.E6]AUR88296.1 hypothetical protein NVP1111B_40 [Vibrio phage 1.111.B._10N.286.45.E6]
MKFEVLSGNYEEFKGKQEANCKYSDEFETFELAFDAYKSQKTMVWSCLLFNDEVICGHFPF